MRPLLLLPLAATLCLAQVPYELRGIVIDAGTNQPLVDAAVSVIPGNGIISRDTRVTELKTDSQGMFRHAPTQAGQYVVRVTKAGYTRAAAQNFSDQGSAVLTEEKPAAEFRLLLQRTAEMRGVVIDDETEKPLAGFLVGVAAYRSTNGQPFARGGKVRSDSEGRFAAPNLAAGEYLIEIGPQAEGQARVRTKFSEEDLTATDLDYRRTFWPGGPEVEAALPVPLTGAGTLNVGTVRARKQPLARVLLDVAPESCPEGAQMRLIETAMFVNTTYPIANVPCGPVLITHFTPGTYLYDLTAGLGAVQVAARAMFTLTGQNLRIPVQLGKGAALRGTVMAASGVGDVDLTKFAIRFGPVSGGIAEAEVQPHGVDARGRFEFANVLAGRRRVDVDGLGDEFYVKEVRIAKQPAPGGLFDFTGTEELEIEIGRSPAAVSGVVLLNDQPVPGADVVFVRWPQAPLDDRNVVKHITADAEGRFRIPSVTPGEYRIFAVAAEDRVAAERPAPWQRLTGFAQQLRLTPGATPDLTLRVSDPRR